MVVHLSGRIPERIRREDGESYRDASRTGAATSPRETAGKYFRAMQIPLVAGRYVTDGDIPARAAERPQAVAVSESLARRYFPGRSAVGHRLRINGARWSTIVGVVGDVRHSSLVEAPQPTVYCQYGLTDSVAIRTIGSPSAIVSLIRRAVSNLSAGVSRGAVVRMVALYGLRLASTGVAIGVCLALALARAVESFLDGVRAVNPITFIAVPALLIACDANRVPW